MKQLFYVSCWGFLPVCMLLITFVYPVSVVWEWVNVALCNLHFLILR